VVSVKLQDGIHKRAECEACTTTRESYMLECNFDRITHSIENIYFHSWRIHFKNNRKIKSEGRVELGDVPRIGFGLREVACP